MAKEQAGFSRRQVLAGMGAFAVAGCGGGMSSSATSGADAIAAASAPPLATAEAAAWMAAAGSEFTTPGYTMKLVGIDLMGAPGNRPDELRQQAFLAVFDVVAGGSMPGDLLYRISHRSIPAFDIFLNPSAANPARMVALFN